VRTAREARVNRHTTDRLFRLLRAALYASRSTDLLVLTPDEVAECDEVYLTAGLKGHAGGLELDRPPRERGLKRRIRDAVLVSAQVIYANGRTLLACVTLPSTSISA
jgi:hypothetical protein